MAKSGVESWIGPEKKKKLRVWWIIKQTINWSNEIGESRIFDTSLCLLMLPLCFATLYYMCTTLIEYVHMMHTYTDTYIPYCTHLINVEYIYTVNNSVCRLYGLYVSHWSWWHPPFPAQRWWPTIPLSAQLKTGHGPWHFSSRCHRHLSSAEKRRWMIMYVYIYTCIYAHAYTIYKYIDTYLHM